MSILRELFVKLGLDVDAQSFAKGTLAADLVKASLAKVVDTAKELAQQFIQNIEQTAQYGDQIRRLSAETGVGTATLQKLGKAAEIEGVGIEDLGHSMVLLSRSMDGARRGSEEQAQAFRKLGIRVTDAHGKLRDGGEVMLDIADKFHAMKDGADKSALSMQFFGRSGASMIELLNRGRGGLEEFGAAFVLTDEQLRAGKEVTQIQRALTIQTQELWRSAIGPLLPAIRDLLKRFYDWKQANADLMKQNIVRFLDAGIAVVKGLAVAFDDIVKLSRFFAENWKYVTEIGITAAFAWAVANGTLTASFIATQAAAVSAALASGAAWAAAFLPITGLLALFDSIRAYNESIQRGGKGTKTVIGQVIAWADYFQKQFTEGKGAMPWWLPFLMQARDLLKEIIELERELGWIQDKHKSNELSRSAADAKLTDNELRLLREHPDSNLAPGLRAKRAGEGWWSQFTAGTMLNPKWGDPNYDPLAGRGQHDMLEPGVARIAGFGPSMPPVAAPPQFPWMSAPPTSFSLTQHIQAAPGMDEERLADHVINKARNVFIAHSDVESAAAAAGHQ